MRKLAIGVFGSELFASKKQLSLAFEVGKEIARSGAVLVNGGRKGTMEACAKGAKKEGGFVVSILLGNSRKEANRYVDVAIPTGLGSGRGILIVRTCDALISIGGGNGTLNELCMGYSVGKPIIGIKGSGGWTDRLVGEYIDEKKKVRIIPAKNAKEAVGLAIKHAKKN